MKPAALFLLPLLASGAAIHSTSEPQILDRQNAAETENLNEVLSKRQDPPARPEIWDVMAKAIAPSLPSILQWGVELLSAYLQWQSIPVKKQTMAPTIDQSAKKEVILFGPYFLKGTMDNGTVSAINMDNKGTIVIRTLKGLPADAAILSAKTGLMYTDGTAANFSNGVYVHHILIADMNKPTAPFALCPELHKETKLLDWAAGYIVEAIGAGLIQVGNDAVHDPNFYGTKQGDMKSAFLTGRDDMFLMQAEVVNYNPTNRSVYLTMEVEYLEKKPKDYIDSSTVVLSATGCGNPGYRPPEGATNYNHTSKPFIIKQSGWIVNARGHLHDGGTSIQLWHNDKMVCDSKPEYGLPPGAIPGSGDTILDMSWCYEPVRLSKGDNLVVKTFYDTALHPMRPDPEAMAMAGGHGGHGAAGGHGEGDMEEMGIMTTNFAWDSSSTAHYPTQMLPPKEPAPGSALAPAPAPARHWHRRAHKITRAFCRTMNSRCFEPSTLGLDDFQPVPTKERLTEEGKSVLLMSCMDGRTVVT